MTVEKIVAKHYDKMWAELCKAIGDELHEFCIIVKVQDGRTVTQSYRDEQERLLAKENEGY